MALLNYFKRVDSTADEEIESISPKANGMQSLQMLSNSCKLRSAEDHESK